MSQQDHHPSLVSRLDGPSCHYRSIDMSAGDAAAQHLENEAIDNVFGQGDPLSDKAMNRYCGIIIALGAALLFGAGPPLAKLALASADPVLVAGLFYLGSGVGLAIVRSIRSGKTRESSLSRADLPWLAGAIFAGGVAGPALLLLGLMTTSASTCIALAQSGGGRNGGHRVDCVP